jgi:hypothetical protein
MYLKQRTKYTLRHDCFQQHKYKYLQIRSCLSKSVTLFSKKNRLTRTIKTKKTKQTQNKSKRKEKKERNIHIKKT